MTINDKNKLNSIQKKFRSGIQLVISPKYKKKGKFSIKLNDLDQPFERMNKETTWFKDIATHQDIIGDKKVYLATTLNFVYLSKVIPESTPESLFLTPF